jgi:hypothetical protein
MFGPANIVGEVALWHLVSSEASLYHPGPIICELAHRVS